MERELERVYSQDRIRKWLKKCHDIEDEIFLKYVYDGYTFKGNYKAIRKPKMRKKIALAFHAQGSSKLLAQHLVDEILRIEKDEA